MGVGLVGNHRHTLGPVASRTSSSRGFSPAWPGVTTTERMRPNGSTAAWDLVDQPPPEWQLIARGLEAAQTTQATTTQTTQTTQTVQATQVRAGIRTVTACEQVGATLKAECAEVWVQDEGKHRGSDDA